MSKPADGTYYVICRVLASDTAQRVGIAFKGDGKQVTLQPFNDPHAHLLKWTLTTTTTHATYGDLQSLTIDNGTGLRLGGNLTTTSAGSPRFLIRQVPNSTEYTIQIPTPSQPPSIDAGNVELGEEPTMVQANLANYAQHWDFVRAQPAGPPQPKPPAQLPDGTYIFCNRVSSPAGERMAITFDGANNKVVLKPNTNANIANQKWKLTTRNDPSVGDQQYMEIDNGTGLQIAGDLTCQAPGTARFLIRELNGDWTIKWANSPYAFDGTNVTTGTPVTSVAGNNSIWTQRWVAKEA